LRGRARLLGPVEDAAPLLSAADAFVSASLFEGWSVAASEALLCGVPAVLTDCGGSRELVGDGARGVLVPNPAGDPLELTAASIATAGAPAELAAALARAADPAFASEERRAEIRRWARERLTADVMVAAHARVLRR